MFSGRHGNAAGVTISVGYRAAAAGGHHFSAGTLHWSQMENYHILVAEVQDIDIFNNLLIDYISMLHYILPVEDIYLSDYVGGEYDILYIFLCHSDDSHPYASKIPHHAGRSSGKAAGQQTLMCHLADIMRASTAYRLIYFVPASRRARRAISTRYAD